VSINQEAMQLHNLVAPPHLLAKPTQGKELLVDYFTSHVVTFTEYLGILQKNKMTKQ
jgi:hypothetical protein